MLNLQIVYAYNGKFCCHCYSGSSASIGCGGGDSHGSDGYGGDDIGGGVSDGTVAECVVSSKAYISRRVSPGDPLEVSCRTSLHALQSTRTATPAGQSRHLAQILTQVLT